MPTTSDGGLLYYRTDLLDKYSLQAADDLGRDDQTACKTIKEGENDSALGCYAGQYQKYEGLTVNFAEAVNGAGGVDHRRRRQAEGQHARRPPRA